mgnify:CR=1 FL=1
MGHAPKPVVEAIKNQTEKFIHYTPAYMYHEPLVRLSKKLCDIAPTLLDLAGIKQPKAMTGHSLGAVGVQEAIYCMLMMQNDFIAPNINVTELDEGTAGFDIVLEKRDAKLNTVMSNSFGFGGVNACLIFRKWAE